MSNTTPIARPWLGDEEVLAVQAVVRSGWLMQGPMVDKFEKDFSDFTGAKYSCATSSGTSALILALKSVGVRPGDVVLTVSHSFIATANAIRACGAEPVFIDIEKNGYNICIGELKNIIINDCVKKSEGIFYNKTEFLMKLAESPLNYVKKPFGRVAAILAVHQMGFPCDIEQVDDISREFNIPWIEDAACAAGSRFQGDLIGRPHSAAACFSFHPRKLITTGDGGMITTNHEKIDNICRKLRQHAIVYADQTINIEGYDCTAYNYRMTDIQAAIGIEQLKRLPEIVERRRYLVDFYRECLVGNKLFYIKSEEDRVLTNWQSLPINFNSEKITYDKLYKIFVGEKIAVRPGIMNAHQEKPYSGVWQLPNSERARKETILMPLFHDLEKSKISDIVKALHGISSAFG